MILYRAMCAAEAVDTMRDGMPSFFRRYKFFSPLESFVRERVQDGEFNNSRFKPTRYTHLLAFEIREIDARWFTKGAVDWKLDRRCQQNVHWNGITLLSGMEMSLNQVERRPAKAVRLKGPAGSNPAISVFEQTMGG